MDSALNQPAPNVNPFPVKEARAKQAERTRWVRAREKAIYERVTRKGCKKCGNRRLVPADNGRMRTCPACKPGRGVR